jgi:hypothetical protein
MDTLRPTEFSDTGVFTPSEQSKYVIITRKPQLKTIDDQNLSIITPKAKKIKMIFQNDKKPQTMRTIKKNYL